MQLRFRILDTVLITFSYSINLETLSPHSKLNWMFIFLLALISVALPLPPSQVQNFDLRTQGVCEEGCHYCMVSVQLACTDVQQRSGDDRQPCHLTSQGEEEGYGEHLD